MPEAQLDRFIMHVRVGYPDVESERAILKLARGEAMQAPVERPQSPLKQEEILQARQEVLAVHMEPSVEEYIVQLINASRHPERYSDQLSGWLDYGASPRGTIALDRCARAYAWLHGRDYVSPDDVQAIAHDVLRHRLLLTFEAEAEGKDADQIINQLLQICSHRLSGFKKCIVRKAIRDAP